MNVFCVFLSTGSSPRLRGTLEKKQEPDSERGIIPALAGNTRCRGTRLFQPRDHPRACGEHIATVAVVGTAWGSSPRLRGTPGAVRPACIRRGIIPALAGNTVDGVLRLGTAGDHPRACGEHCDRQRVAARDAGSSPRLRGTRASHEHQRFRRGIIPALAGNTRCGRRSRTPSWDHPRACGEHSGDNTNRIELIGSSPRLRGTPVSISLMRPPPGIIPALAGNTRCCVRAWSSGWDHPRACGEHESTTLKRMRREGSSPRLRGTLIRRMVHPAHDGIIPALAGNTHSRPCPMADGGDHPRACGEHSAWKSPPRISPGSSPRLRGTRGFNQRYPPHAGIIPALAGNTL